jgi:hypothetical protein
MTRQLIKRRGDAEFQDNGIWAGTIGFQCPWAHPIWSEYLLFVYDFAKPLDGKQPKKLNEAATHEFMLYAVAPETPIDFDKPLFEQRKLSPLTPPNHGYQFTAASNDEAWDRVNALVDECYKELSPGVFVLNPDTDYRRSWDNRMVDGWTLHEQ